MTPTLNLAQIIAQLPADSTLILRHVSWEVYEDLPEAVGEAKCLRISFNQGRLQIMTLSTKHEKLAFLMNDLVRSLSLRLRIKVLSYGSATMKKQRASKGAEPDVCFYIQHADLVGKKEQIEFNTDPPPDVVMEVDLHHESLSKFPDLCGPGCASALALRRAGGDHVSPSAGFSTQRPRPARPYPCSPAPR